MELNSYNQMVVLTESHIQLFKHYIFLSPIIKNVYNSYSPSSDSYIIFNYYIIMYISVAVTAVVYLFDEYLYTIYLSLVVIDISYLVHMIISYMYHICRNV